MVVAPVRPAHVCLQCRPSLASRPFFYARAIYCSIGDPAADTQSLLTSILRDRERLTNACVINSILAKVCRCGGDPALIVVLVSQGTIFL